MHDQHTCRDTEESDHPLDAPTPYDAIAEWYSASIAAGSAIHDIVVPALHELARPRRAEKVLDLACGEGVVARSFARAGAYVRGVDVSLRLLELARQVERADRLHIVYRRDDAQQLASVDDASVDGVVSSLALTDIPDLAATVHAVHRVLRPGGWFAFAINHPCGPVSSAAGSLVYASRDYFEAGFWMTDNLASVRGRVGAYHRPLSTYVNALVAGRLSVEECLEPRATPVFVERIPDYAGVPIVLAMRCRKIAS